MFGGKFMDNFMDKLAQKFNAQDMIKANTQAEAEETERLKKQVERYEACLEEMRQTSQQNVGVMNRLDELVQSLDNSNRLLDNNVASINQMEAPSQNFDEKINLLVESGMEKFREMEASKMSTAELEEKIDQLFAESMEQIRTIMDEQQGQLEEKFQGIEDYVHRENVKVYRNVQSVVVDENAKETKEITDEVKRNTEKLKEVSKVSTITLLMVVIGIIIQVVNMITNL